MGVRRLHLVVVWGLAAAPMVAVASPKHQIEAKVHGLADQVDRCFGLGEDAQTELPLRLRYVLQDGTLKPLRVGATGPARQAVACLGVLLSRQSWPGGSTTSLLVEIRLSIAPEEAGRRRVQTQVTAVDEMGSLDKADIVEVMNRQASAFEACYDEAGRPPGAVGRIALGLLVDAAGGVESVVVLSSVVRDDTLEACVLRRIESVTFPRPKGAGPVVISWPVVFRAGGIVERWPGPPPSVLDDGGHSPFRTDRAVDHGDEGFEAAPPRDISGALPTGRGEVDLPPPTRGSLDKALIQTVIRSHISEVRYCYEKELQETPELAGKVHIKFTIGGEGAVTTAETVKTTLGDSDVERCLEAAVKRWEFPKPKGGGLVIVTYPFVFKTRSDAPEPPTPAPKPAPKPAPAATAPVKGGLDKEVIARVVRSHQNEVTFCYERVLSEKPRLEGLVATFFIIGPTGGVTRAVLRRVEPAGMREVADCVVERVRRWTFPKPKGGGTVEVNYPWIFKPANASARVAAFSETTAGRQDPRVGRALSARLLPNSALAAEVGVGYVSGRLVQRLRAEGRAKVVVFGVLELDEVPGEVPVLTGIGAVGLRVAIVERSRWALAVEGHAGSTVETPSRPSAGGALMGEVLWSHLEVRGAAGAAWRRDSVVVEAGGALLWYHGRFNASLRPFVDFGVEVPVGTEETAVGVGAGVLWSPNPWHHLQLRLGAELVGGVARPAAVLGWRFGQDPKAE